MCWSLFLIRPSGLQLFEKETPSQASQVFSCEIYGFFKENLFLQNTPVAEGL